MDYQLESFINFCDDMMIAKEGLHMITGNGCQYHPVFIVLLYSDSTFDHVAEKFVKNQEYWHASIGFGPALSTLYSFNFGEAEANKLKGGLSYESMDFYQREHPTGNVCVSCIFLTQQRYQKLRETLNYYIKNKKKTRYSFINLVYSLFGKVKTSKKNLSLVCSTFVDTILKSVDVRLNDKPTNLVKPDDLKSGHSEKEFVVFKGRIKDYDAEEASKIVEKMANDKTYSYFNKTDKVDSKSEVSN